MTSAAGYAIKGMLSEMNTEKVNIVQSRFDAFMQKCKDDGEESEAISMLVIAKWGADQEEKS